MPEQQAKTGGGGKGKGRKVGREKNHPCHVAYKNEHRREKNKLKRVLRSNGVKFAEKYAMDHNLRLHLKV